MKPNTIKKEAVIKFRGQTLSFLFLMLITMLGFQSCADDLTVSSNLELDENIFEINFAIPEATEMKVRAKDDERAIKTMTVFFFKEDGTLAINPESTPTLSESKIVLTISPGQRKNIKTICAVANGSNITDILNITSLADLEEKTTNSEIDLSDGFLMYGKVSDNSASNNSVTVELKRIASSLTVSQSEDVKDFTLTNFEVMKGATSGKLKAPEYLTDDSRFATNNLDKTISGIPGEVSYLYPVKGYGNSDDGAFVILTATYKPEEEKNTVQTYYRLNLRLDSEESEEFRAPNFINFEPNTKYTLIIKKIEGVGHATKEEAMEYVNGDDNVKYEIHDHSLNILSMTSDGVRELGMTYDFDWVGVTEKYITVKWYSVEESIKDEDLRYSDIQAPVILQGSGWLALEEAEYDTESNRFGLDEIDGDGYGDLDKVPGVTKKYKLILLNGKYQRAKIAVSWRGLTREVNVTKIDAVNNLSDVCNAELQIYKGSVQETVINDYWAFLAGEGNDKLYGVSYGSMGDKNRDEGFHFAMPYGESYDYEYKYRITFPEEKYTDIKGVTLSYGDGDFVSGNLNLTEWDSSKKECYLSMNRLSEEFAYKTGSIVLNVVHSGGTEHFGVKVYHTGFFHKDDKAGKKGNAYRGSASTEDAGYYYYEVVTLEGLHWLDRNLGAKGAGVYIETDTDASVFQQDDPSNFFIKNSCGEFFKPADNSGYHTENGKEVYNYGDVQMKDEELCPPGYRVPWKSEFDKLRHSINFIQKNSTRGGIAHYTSYYETNGKEGNIYFPKSRFESRDNGNSNYFKVGDSRAGYYVTRTQSAGLEKEQIGRWLNALYISGTTTSYVNYNVDDYRMNVRCVAGSITETNENPESATTIAFEVKGATHVYLYDKNNHSPIFTFPGKAIGSIDAINDYLYFSYNSSSRYEDLLVLFTKVDASGKVTLFYTDENKNGTEPTDSNVKSQDAVNVKEYLDCGWKVEKGGKYDLTSDKMEEEYLPIDPNWPTKFKKGDHIDITWPKVDLPNRSGYLRYIYLFYKWWNTKDDEDCVVHQDGSRKYNEYFVTSIDKGKNFRSLIVYNGDETSYLYFNLSYGSLNTEDKINMTKVHKLTVADAIEYDPGYTIPTWTVKINEIDTSVD